MRLCLGLRTGLDAGQLAPQRLDLDLSLAQLVGQLDAFGLGQLLALLHLVAFGAQAIGRGLGLGGGSLGLGVRVIEFGAQLTRPTLNFFGPALGHGGPLLHAQQGGMPFLDLLPARLGQLGRLASRRLQLGNAALRRLQLGRLRLVGIGHLLVQRLGLDALRVPARLRSPKGLVRQLLSLLPQGRQRGAAGLLNGLGHLDGHRGRLGGLRTPPFLHAGAGVVHVDAGDLPHGIDRGKGGPAGLLVERISGGKDAVAGVFGEFHGARLRVE